MRFLSLFSGVDAASLAWVPLGWECVGFAEIDAFPSRVLRARWPDVPNLGDVRELAEHPERLSALGPIDVVVGGFPCQDVSVAGRRAGLKDEGGRPTRSGLFYDAVRIVRASGARWTVVENVPGLFTSPEGNPGGDFASVVGELAGCDIDVPDGGWRDAGVAVGPDGLVEWCVLDAQWFGLAQRRERVFLVRDSGAWSRRPPVLLEREGLRGDPAPSRETRSRVAGALTSGASRGGGHRVGGDEAAAGQLVSAPDVAATLAAGGGAHSVGHNGADERVIAAVDVAPTLRSGPPQGTPSHGKQNAAENTAVVVGGAPAPVAVDVQNMRLTGDKVGTIQTGQAHGGHSGHAVLEHAPEIGRCANAHRGIQPPHATTYVVNSETSKARAAAHPSELARALDTNGSVAAGQGGTVAIDGPAVRVLLRRGKDGAVRELIQPATPDRTDDVVTLWTAGPFACDCQREALFVRAGPGFPDPREAYACSRGRFGLRLYAPGGELLWSEWTDDEPQTFDWQAGGGGADASFRGKGRSWIHDEPGRCRALQASKVPAVLAPQDGPAGTLLGDAADGSGNAPMVVEREAPGVAATLTTGSNPNSSAPGRRREDDDNLVIERATGGEPTPIHSDAVRPGEARTPSRDAEGRVRLRDPGMGVGSPGDPMFTLGAGAPHAVSGCYRKSRRAQDATDDETWVEADEGPGNTLNAFDDGGDARATHAVVEEGPALPATALQPNFSNQSIASDVSPPVLAGQGGIAVHDPRGGAPEEPTYVQPVADPVTAQEPRTWTHEGVTFRTRNVTAFGLYVRRLTPVECERLQGMPDGHTDVGDDGLPGAKDTPRFRAIGNSMAVPVMRWIGERIDAANAVSLSLASIAPDYLPWRTAA